MQQQWQYIWLDFGRAGKLNEIYTTVNGTEYKGLNQCRELLNDLGRNGWELTGVTTIGNDEELFIEIHMIFKRSI